MRVRETQKEKLLNYLLRKGKVTTMEAQRKLDIVDPQTPIMKLRREGYQIIGEWKKSRLGKKYMEYYLKGEK